MEAGHGMHNAHATLNEAYLQTMITEHYNNIVAGNIFFADSAKNKAPGTKSQYYLELICTTWLAHVNIQGLFFD